MARIEMEVDLEVLAWTLASELTESTLIGFIMEIDEARVDLNFTKSLRSRLDRVIREEEDGTD